MIIDRLFKAIFGDRNTRRLKKMQPLLERINRLYEEYHALSDDELRAKTPEFRERLKNGETTDDILCEAYAVVKDACRRLVGSKIQVTVTGDDAEVAMAAVEKFFAEYSSEA